MYEDLVANLRAIEAYGSTEISSYEAGQYADAIENLSKPDWISVKEQLPEEDGCYLVAVKNDHQRRYSKTAWFSHDSWFARQDVTHWMPLPEPPNVY